MAATSEVGKLYFVVLFIVSLSLTPDGAKLNAPKVLLPFYSSVIANFTLEVEFPPDESAESSCYRWRSTRQEVAQVQLINSTDGGECSHKALVSAVSKTSHQMTTVVLAENRVTGEILRCNVIVSEITKLVIDTTTRLLYLEDSPEELVARGYDSEGNIFSSLEGLSFEWSLVSDTETGHDVIDAHNILRIKMFADSHYTTPSHIAPLEDRGLQGDRILVEGIRTGSAKVSMKLKDPLYKHIDANDVRIMVVANLMLSPSDAYLLKFATVKYIVELLKHNTLTKIKMPSPQYYLELKDTSLCELDTPLSVVTALDMGSTEIVLKDRNILVTEFFRQPSAMIHVVSPGYLAFVVLPTKKWVLETGREYEILIEVYDKDSHKIYPSDNVRIQAQFPSKYFKVFFSSENGTYHHVRTLMEGFTDIDGALTAVIKEDGSVYGITPNVKGSQEVEIYDAIVVEPRELFFPWDPLSLCKHTYKIKASGGSGEYVWSSLNASITSVNIKGEITTSGPGTTNITAADAKNSAHTGTVQVHVLPPSALSFPLGKVEAAVGAMLVLPLQVSAKFKGKEYSFNDCRQLPLNVTFTDASVFKKHEGDLELVEEGCCVLKFIAVRPGHTEVTVSHQSGKHVLQDSLTIAAYNPLKPIDPEKEVVIAVGTIKEVLFKGGPQPWVLDSSRYFQNLHPKTSSILRQEKTDMFSVNTCEGIPGVVEFAHRYLIVPSDNDAIDPTPHQSAAPSQHCITFASSLFRGYHAFTVLCKDFGEQSLKLEVGNEKTAKNQFPAIEETQIRFLCARPVELHLQPIFHHDSSLPPCPVTHETHLPIPINCKHSRDILVSVTDSSGRRFDNFSSLAIEWSLSDTSLASVPTPRELVTDVTSGQDWRKIIRTFQTLHPEGKTGTVVVTASVKNYLGQYLNIAGSTVDENISPKISKSIELLLVDPPSISPELVSIFNHPSNMVSIDVKQGSGYFYIEECKSDAVGLKYDVKSKSVMVSPLKDGSQSFTVYDLCLDHIEHPVGTVHISGVGSVRVTVLDKVEVRKEVKARVEVLDVHGNALLSSFFSLMGLKLEPSSDIVAVRLSPEKGDKLSAVYTVYGAVVGHTSLTASVSLLSGQIIHSSAKPLEVFPPLRLEPKNITIMIGAKFQVMATGGPQPQSTVEFTIKNKKISSVLSSGLLEGLEQGTTTVVAKAVGSHPASGETVVYSQDDAIVNVVILAGIQIYTPLTRLQTGTQMPVYAIGLTEHESPFTFGSSQPPLLFDWSASSREVVSLSTVFYKSNLRLPEESDFAKRLFAQESGHVTLHLRVTLSKQNSNEILGDLVLRDEVQIEVFEKLALLSPSVCDGQLLITPNTQTNIKTNRDLAARLTYHVLPSEDGKQLFSVSKTGELTTKFTTGSATVLVTAQEEFGVNQTLVFLVKVKPVSYVMINADTPLSTSSGHLTTIPVGATLKFSVSYHDDVGAAFFATNTNLQIRCSRYDLLQVSKETDNSTLTVKVAEPGQTILRVWDLNNHWITDYINIPAGNVITPTDTIVTLGTVMCFNTTLVSTTGYGGHWNSKGRCVDVLSQSGVATAVCVGKSVILFKITDDLSTYTEMTIAPILKIRFGGGGSFITNAPGRKPVNIPVILGDSTPLGDNCNAQLKSKSYQPPFQPYHCYLELLNKNTDIDIERFFVVSPVFDTEKGQPVCQITQRPSSDLAHEFSSLTSQIRLVAVVTQQEGQPPLEAAMELDLVPAFYVHTSEVHVTTLAPLSFIRISTLPDMLADIEASVSDNTLITVLAPEQDSQSASTVRFPVRLLDSLSIWEREKLELHVELRNKKTGQEVHTPIFIKLIGEKPDLPYLRTVYAKDVGWSTLLVSFLLTYQSWFAIFFLILATAIAVLVGYHFLIGPRYRTSADNSVFLNTSQKLSPGPNVSFVQQSHSGSPPPYDQYGASPTSPRLWSVPPYSPDTSSSPYRRNPYSRT